METNPEGLFERTVTVYDILRLMKIFIGGGHRGVAAKQQLISWLKEKEYEVEDCGNTQFDALDDYPDFAQKVAQKVLENRDEHLGIVICGSGIGVCIAANRFKGIRCGLALNEEQVGHGRAHDHLNILALSTDHFNLEKLQTFVERFLKESPLTDEKYTQRMRKLDL